VLQAERDWDFVMHPDAEDERMPLVDNVPQGDADRLPDDEDVKVLEREKEGLPVEESMMELRADAAAEAEPWLVKEPEVEKEEVFDNAATLLTPLVVMHAEDDPEKTIDGVGKGLAEPHVDKVADSVLELDKDANAVGDKETVLHNENLSDRVALAETDKSSEGEGDNVAETEKDAVPH